MPSRIERYEIPADTETALSLLAAESGRARVIAGGTDIVPDRHNGRASFAVAVDIHRLPLGHTRLQGDELVIGALVTHRELESPLITNRAPALAEAAGSIGGVQARNMGTIGGNVGGGIPSADLVPALLVADAVAVLRSSSGTRQVPLAEFFLAPRRTVLAPAELVLELRLQNLAPSWQSAFIKFGPRRAMALATLNLAAAVRLEHGRSDHGRIADARVAAGLVAPVPVRLRAVEAVLRGATRVPQTVERAVQAIAETVRPRDSLRGSAAYRRSLAGVGLRRLLNRLLDLAEEGV